jgi:(R,R)-butanediol dehydrogenase / meso-butanediol dehydrogenase / diacetyl reductase
MAIAMHALSRGAARPGEPAVIVGAGGIGSLLIAAAAARDIPAHVLDLDEQRLQAVRELGAITHSPSARGSVTRYRPLEVSSVHVASSPSAAARRPR